MSIEVGRIESWLHDAQRLRRISAVHIGSDEKRSAAGFPISLTIVLYSFAQNLEDVVLWRVLGQFSPGTYVDVGAAHPEIDNVTHLFHDHGWTGLHVEPLAEFAEALRLDRPDDVVVEACAGSRTGEALLHAVSETGLSTLVDAEVERLQNEYTVNDVVVPVRTLDEILEGAGFGSRPIHFLKVDVEGYEEEVLKGIDLSIWRPWIIVVEATAPESTLQVHERWESLVLDRGYEHCLFDGLNRFYLAEEHSELRTALSYPACVFDRPYTQRESPRLEATYLEALESYQRLEATYKETLESYERLEATHEEALAGYRRLQAANDALQSQHAEMSHDLDEARIQVDIERATVDALRNSTAWRLTAPVRRAADFARSVVQRRSAGQSAN